MISTIFNAHSMAVPGPRLLVAPDVSAEPVKRRTSERSDLRGHEVARDDNTILRVAVVCVSEHIVSLHPPHRPLGAPSRSTLKLTLLQLAPHTRMTSQPLALRNAAGQRSEGSRADHTNELARGVEGSNELLH